MTKYKIGDPVKANGYAGKVLREYLAPSPAGCGIYEVRLEAGVVCMAADELEPMATIEDIKNEIFTVTGTEKMEGLDHFKNGLIDSKHEPAIYLLERYIVGTRKKTYTVRCIKGAESGIFRTL